MYPRRPLRWETTFGRFVIDFGVRRLASALEVRDQAIYHWVAGRHLPQPTRARQLVALSGGQITLEDLYRTAEPTRGAPGEATGCASISRSTRGI